MLKDLLLVLAKNLVESPDEVNVTVVEKSDGSFVYELRVAEKDMGRVIGRGGRIAKAIRNVMKAAASKENVQISVDIIG